MTSKRYFPSVHIQKGIAKMLKSKFKSKVSVSEIKKAIELIPNYDVYDMEDAYQIGVKILEKYLKTGIWGGHL